MLGSPACYLWAWTFQARRLLPGRSEEFIMNRFFALRLLAVVAILVLLGGPALSAHADTGSTTVTHPSIAVRQVLAGTPVTDPVETAPPVHATELQETAAPVQAEATLAPTEPIETLPPTTEPVETETPVAVEPTEDDFIFVFCHVSSDGSQVTMRFSINDPAGADFFIVPAHGDAILLFPDDYWGECIAPSPTVVPPTEQPTQVTVVPTATIVPSQTAQPTMTATAPVGTPPPTTSASPTTVPGSPTAMATTDSGTPSGTAPATVIGPTATPTATTVPSGTTVPATATVSLTTPMPTVPTTEGPIRISTEMSVVNPAGPATGQPGAPADVPSTIDPVTGLPVAGSGPSDTHAENTAIVSVLLVTAVALGYSAVRARRRGI